MSQTTLPAKGVSGARATSGALQANALNLGLLVRLAWRNVGRHRRRTMIVVLAIGLGLAMMMFYDGIVAGYEQAIYGNAIKILGGNMRIHAQGYSQQTGQNPLFPLTNDAAVIAIASAQPQVLAAVRRINTGGLASNREGAFPVAITGIEPEGEAPVSLIAKHMVAGRYLQAGDQDLLLIGKGLADAMAVAVGDRINLVGRAPHNQMRQRSMTIVGIYDTGLRDIEKRSVYMALGEAQNLYELHNQATEVALTLKQIGQEGAVIAAIQPSLPQNEFETWATLFPDLQSALQSKGGAMNVFSVIIVVIAGIGILNLLLMAVYERTREIGLLGALGLKPGQISLLFVLEGAAMGLIGVAFGVALGLLINVSLGQIGMDFSKYASLTDYTALIDGRIYPSLGLDKLPQRALTILIVALLASFYPAREAARSEPALALHHV